MIPEETASVRPYQYIDTPDAWHECVTRLRAEPRIALDVEANSLYVYREYLCLLQISIPCSDYIVDPLAGFPLEGLGEILADPAVEKVFHASEYDLILLKRDYDWDVVNMFDSMWAARILGYQNMGLAWFLEHYYGVTLSKKHQKANWGFRPLTESQLEYAQKDTHYLLALRDRMAAELEEQGRMEEAREIFAQAAQVKVPDRSFNENSFWSIAGAHDLPPKSRAILQALDHLRDSEAKRRNLPPFKVMSNTLLVSIAKKRPRDRAEMEHVPGMTRPVLDRYGDALLNATTRGMKAPVPRSPQRPARLSEEERDRLEMLTDWRKRTAIERGVSSDVVLHRDTLFELARCNPATEEALTEVEGIGPARRALYGRGIITLLQDAPQSPANDVTDQDLEAESEDAESRV
jgi:ribonuclease D